MHRTVTATSVLLGLTLLLTACGGEPSAAPAPADEAPEAAASSEPPATTSPSPSRTTDEVAAEDYAPSRFDAVSTVVDHPHYPLRPGTRMDYVGSSVEDGERLHHQVSVVVTDLTKVIDGVESVVIWERDFTEGELVEAELAMFAQDTDGHVWHFGQYPEEYEEGEVAATPAWLHGFKGAYAGVLIPASPRVGTSDYAQGFAPPPLNWVDRGRVYATDQSTCVPADCYDGVVVIEEFETGVPQAFQDKHYAPDVGVVRVGWRGAQDENKEVLKLVRVRDLGPAALAKARKEARVLEDRAYQRSKDVFGQTQRMTGPDA